MTAKKTEPDPRDKWVVMIYMAATTPQLRAAMERDLKELNVRLANLDRDDIYVVVQADTPDGEYVTRQRLMGDCVRNLPVVTRANGNGKGQFLADFIHWRFHGGEGRCRGGVPVEKFGRTLLVLWGHAQGVAAALSQPGSQALSVVGRGGFGFDPLLGEALTLKELRQTLLDGFRCEDGSCTRWSEGGRSKTIDILSFDSCFMSAAEAAVELQSAPPPDGGSALAIDYLLAAQTAILLDGLDYSRLADAFVPQPGISPEKLGRRLLQQAAYGEASPTSLSLVHLSGGGNQRPIATFEDCFARLTTELARILGIELKGHELKEEPGTNPPTTVEPQVAVANRSEWLRIRDAFESATWHRVRQFVDLGDLCRRLMNNSRDTRLRKAAWAVLESLELHPPGDEERPNGEAFLIDVRSAHPLILSGLSLYCPWLYPTPAETRAGAWNAVVDLKEYSNLRFARTTRWGEFVHRAHLLREESRQRGRLRRVPLVAPEAAGRSLPHGGAAGGRPADRRGFGDRCGPAPRAVRLPRRHGPGGGPSLRPRTAVVDGRGAGAVRQWPRPERRKSPARRSARSQLLTSRAPMRAHRPPWLRWRRTLARGAVVLMLAEEFGLAQDAAPEARGGAPDVQSLREDARRRREGREVERARESLLRAKDLLAARASPAEVAVDVLLDLAEVELDLWQGERAVARLDDAALALESAGRQEDERRLRMAELRARSLRVRGDYPAARHAWLDVVSARRAQEPPNVERLAFALAALAEAQWFTGDLEGAEALFVEAHQLAESLPSGSGEAVARRLNDLGLVAETRGEVERAESLYHEALERMRRALGEVHPSLAGRWIALGNVALLREDLVAADAAYERAAAILAPLTDLSLASEQATLELNRGALDARLGRVESARPRFARARELWTRTRGPGHPHLAWVGESLADVLAEANRLDEAGVALSQAHQVRERAMPGSASTVLTAARLAAHRAREGNAGDARALLRRVDAGARAMADPGVYFRANLAARRAEAAEGLGELGVAARWREDAERHLRRLLPAGHPALAEARGQRARIAWLRGRHDEAGRWTSEAWQAQRRAVVETLHALPEGDALRYVERTRALRDLLLCTAATAPQALAAGSRADDVMRELAASRALVSGALYARDRLVLDDAGRTFAAADDAQALAVAQRRFATLLWNPALGDASYVDALARAGEDLHQAERSATRRRAGGRRGAASGDRTARDPWDELGSGEALVAFGRYRCPSRAAVGPSSPPTSGYLAFVRHAGRPVRIVRFDGAALDQAVERWYAAIAGAAYAPPTEAQSEEVQALGAALSRRLWQPVARHLGGARRVFLVPDGLLHYVSWYALPASGDRYLVDEPRLLHVLSAESELGSAPGEARPSGEGTVVVMAEPTPAAADSSASTNGAAPDAGGAALRSACRFVDLGRLPRLGEAREEARALQSEAGGSGRRVLVATGADASEAWLRAHAPGARILHVAAHAGLLAPESCREPPAAGGRVHTEARTLWESTVRARPLMRSGLLLSGGAPAAATDDDGLLVAEEAARLDLREADWVVLSACSSRRGVVLDGEGMLGLHRAFHAAGARTVIASLWDVEDGQARRFMRDLYAARLRQGRSTIDAMRSATLAVLDDLRARGQSTHPARWAAFVASGDWR